MLIIVLLLILIVVLYLAVLWADKNTYKDPPNGTRYVYDEKLEKAIDIATLKHKLDRIEKELKTKK